MKTHLFKQTLLTLIFVASINLYGQEPQASYYSKTIVEGILNQPGCEGIRIYPVLDSNSTVNTTMIIGIDTEGKEIYNSQSTELGYQMFTKIEENVVKNKLLTQAQAKTVCSNYEATTPFVSDFNKQTLNQYLGENSDGLFLSYTSEGDQNFTVQTYTDDGGIKILENSTAGSPCPRICGDDVNYLRILGD